MLCSVFGLGSKSTFRAAAIAVSVFLTSCASVSVSGNADFPRTATPEEQEAVLLTLDQFLLGWAERDEEKMRDAIDGQGEARILRQNGIGQVNVANNSLLNLTRMLDRPKRTEQRLYWDARVNLQAPGFATVRANLARLLDGERSYCAIGFLTLAKADSGWEILEYIETYDEAELRRIGYDDEPYCSELGYQNAERRPAALDAVLNAGET